MKRFKFYHIHEKYISFLHSVDKRVLFNKGEHRPYVGIVLQINELNYYVPLESPKPSHAKLRSSGPVLKIDEGKMGIMGFNNMIPVPDEALIYFDFDDIEDQQYRMLLINQQSGLSRFSIHSTRHHHPPRKRPRQSRRTQSKILIGIKEQRRAS